MNGDDTDPDLEQQVDAMERRVLGATQDRPREDPDGAEPGEPGDPATFAVDLEPEDQGTADAAAESSG